MSKQNSLIEPKNSFNEPKNSFNEPKNSSNKPKKILFCYLNCFCAHLKACFC